ncbi:unnamed protein product, partial [Durusdinium trenchii]
AFYNEQGMEDQEFDIEIFLGHRIYPCGFALKLANIYKELTCDSSVPEDPEAYK